MNTWPCMVIPAETLTAGDRIPSFDGFGATVWLEVQGLVMLGGDVEVQFGPGASRIVSRETLFPVARP